MLRLAVVLGLVASAFGAPLNVKVAKTGKVYASENLLASLKEEVSSAATEEIDFFLRSLGGAGRSSFLKEKTFPCSPLELNGCPIRMGMYISESLRAPPQQVLNVVEREPTHAIVQRAHNDALVAKVAALNRSFRRGL